MINNNFANKPKYPSLYPSNRVRFSDNTTTAPTGQQPTTEHHHKSLPSSQQEHNPFEMASQASMPSQMVPPFTDRSIPSPKALKHVGQTFDRKASYQSSIAVKSQQPPGGQPRVVNGRQGPIREDMGPTNSQRPFADRRNTTHHRDRDERIEHFNQPLGHQKTLSITSKLGKGSKLQGGGGVGNSFTMDKLDESEQPISLHEVTELSAMQMIKDMDRRRMDQTGGTDRRKRSQRSTKDMNKDLYDTDYLRTKNQQKMYNQLKDNIDPNLREHLEGKEKKKLESRKPSLKKASRSPDANVSRRSLNKPFFERQSSKLSNRMSTQEFFN